MIKKNKLTYLNYVQDIKDKIDKLCEKVPPFVMSGNLEKLRIKIFTITDLITDLANQEVGLIPKSDWQQYQKDIDTLYKQLFDGIIKYLRNQKKHGITH